MNDRLAPLRQYLHQGNVYYHEMDLNSDTVIVRDFEGRHLLIFDSSARLYHVSQLSREALHGVLKKLIQHNMPIIGHCRLNDEELWVFESNDTEIVSKYGLRHMEGLIDFEVDIAKWWLDKYPYIANKHELQPELPIHFTMEQIQELGDL